MKAFNTLLAGQLLSALGTNQSAFALGLWLFQTTNSATTFSIYMFCAFLPGVLLSPFAGVIIDRLDRRNAMLLSDIGAAIATAAIALALFSSSMEIWHLYAIASVKSIFTQMQRSAYTASVSVLVEKEKLGKASGLVQMSIGISQMIAPALGGVLFVAIGIEGIILFDFLTFIIAIGATLLVRFPATPQSQQGAQAKGTVLSEAAFGFKYLKQRPGLLRLLWYIAGINFFIGAVYALATPAILLSFENDTVILGVLMSVAGLGMMSGSVLMSIWGGPPKQVYGVVGFSALTGLGILLVGIEPTHPALLGVFVFMIMFGAPFIMGCSQVIWQKKVALDIQGKVFGVRQMVASLSIPLAYMVTGPLADNVFEPLMAQQHQLIPLLPEITGTGPGAGIRLMFFLMGMIMFLMVIWAARSRHLKHVEERLPDADTLVQQA